MKYAASLLLAICGLQPPAAPRFPFPGDEAKRYQEAAAAALGVDPVLINSLGMKLAFIPAGRFEMGPNGSKYRVDLSKPFFMATTEVTLGQYRKYKPGHEIEGAEPAFNEDNRPVAMVTWNDARAFCDWLSGQPGEQERTYALPTEAQWEWAARAGTATLRPFGDTDKELPKFAWFNATYTPNPKKESGGRGRQPVAKLLPNAWGLHDMLGNVWEWCADRRVDEATGETREPVMRGGGWRSGGSHCTVVAHDPGAPNLKADHIGFRVVCSLASLPQKRP